jgi:hypothetical protein
MTREADPIPDDNLEIAKGLVPVIPKIPHRPRHGHKSYPGKRSPDHPESHQHPVGIPVADKKGFVVGMTGSTPGYQPATRESNRSQKKKENEEAMYEIRKYRLKRLNFNFIWPVNPSS